LLLYDIREYIGNKGKAVGRGRAEYLQTSHIYLITSYHSVFMFIGQRRVAMMWAL
jgi:hypothetical protein